MDSHFSLPGIRSISYVAANVLPDHIAYMRASRIPIKLNIMQTSVPFVGEPTCETESTKINKAKKQSTTLNFRCTQPLPEDYALAFVVTDNNSQNWLIGQREEPFPLVSCTQTFGTTDGDPSSLTVAVTFEASEALIPIEME